jgi:hypothetical protein
MVKKIRDLLEPFVLVKESVVMCPRMCQNTEWDET